MTPIIKAMVENPYYQRRCNLGRVGDYTSAVYFEENIQEEYLPLDVFMNNGIYYPYFLMEYMTDVWFGMKIKSIGVKL